MENIIPIVIKSITDKPFAKKVQIYAWTFLFVLSSPFALSYTQKEITLEASAHWK